MLGASLEKVAHAFPESSINEFLGSLQIISEDNQTNTLNQDEHI